METLKAGIQEVVNGRVGPGLVVLDFRKADYLKVTTLLDHMDVLESNKK